jgi:endonuclease YncB( thermonuclease family)
MSLRPFAALLSTLVFAAAFGAAAGRAEARTGSCLVGESGPSCHIWTGRVTFVDDGDTIDVDVAGDGTTRPARVRITGIQAMEQTVYSSDPHRRRGECHALAATARLERMIRKGHRRVRLAAQDPASTTGGRLRRSIAVRMHGRWRDVGRVLVAGGDAIWLPNSTEYAWNRAYSVLAERAAAAGIGLWNPAGCGSGPSQSSPLQMTLNWDADGDDNLNVNGEWVRIRNLDPRTDVPLGGWWLRDSALRRYRFPAWARIPAGGTVTFHVGRGTSSGTTFYWGLWAPAFENARGDARGMGDGAYLFDPQGDLRAWSMYH